MIASRVNMALYYVIVYACRALFSLIGGYRVEGAENMPRAGPLLVVSNHLHNIDPFVVGAALPRPIAYLAKVELFSVPVVSQVLRYFWTIPIDRGGADRQAVKTALERLASGRPVAIFPEGTRSHDHAMKRGQLGVGLLAARSGALVLPIGIAGSERPLRLWPRPTKTVRIGRPFRIERPAGRRPDYQAITDQIMAEVAALAPPAYRGVYAAPPPPSTISAQPPAAGEQTTPSAAPARSPR